MKKLIGNLLLLLGTVFGALAAADEMIRERCLLLAWAEGERGFARNLARKSKKICRRHGGFSLTGYPVRVEINIGASAFIGLRGSTL